MATTADVWTVVKLIQWSADYLQSKGIDEGRLNAERMLAHVLNLDRVGLYLHFDRPLTDDELQAYKKLLLRRAKREPLQYILGETEFFGLPFSVRPGVLVPRPETEVLVQEVIDLAVTGISAPRVLDVGTGSGIIAVSLAVSLPQATLVAVDVSPAALEVAKENADRHGVASRIQFRQLDILAEGVEAELGGPFEFVVSNPPYITHEERGLLEPEVAEHEPPEALFVDNPLLFYEKLTSLGASLLAADGWLLCEIAPHRAAEVQSLFERSGFRDVSVRRDLAGRERVIRGRT